MKSHRKIVVYNCNELARKYISKYGDSNVELFVDDKCDVFCSHNTVKSADFFNCINTYESIQLLILVFANNWYEYSKIKTDLESLGYSEFDDFIQGHIYGKKLVLLWGNCHVQVAADMLEHTPEFDEEYAVYKMIPTWQLKDGYVSDELFAHIDLLLAQPLRDDNRIGSFASLDKVRKKIRSDCKVIVIPNLYGACKGLYQQIQCTMYDMVTQSYNKLDKGINYAWFKDAYIEQYLDDHSDADCNDVIDYLLSLKFDSDLIRQAYGRLIAKIEAFDAQSDVKLLDFVNDKMKTEKLFIDPEHPSSYFLHFYAEQIAAILGLNVANIPKSISFAYAHEIPMYPQVKAALGFMWPDGDMKNCNPGEKLIDVYMDFKEYVRQYIAVRKMFI